MDHLPRQTAVTRKMRPERRAACAADSRAIGMGLPMTVPPVQTQAVGLMFTLLPFSILSPHLSLWGGNIYCMPLYMAGSM